MRRLIADRLRGFANIGDGESQLTEHRGLVSPFYVGLHCLIDVSQDAVDRRVDTGTDVERLAGDIGIHRSEQARDNIVNVDEVATLLAVAIDRRGLTL